MLYTSTSLQKLLLWMKLTVMLGRSRIVVLWFMALWGLGYVPVVAEDRSATLEMVIGHMRAGRKAIFSYKANYDYWEKRLPYTPTKGQEEPGFELKTTGEYVIDRLSGQFRDVRQKSPSWNASASTWNFGKIYRAQYNGKNVSLLNGWEGLADPPIGIFRRPMHELGREAGVYGPEKYFSRYVGTFHEDIFDEHKQYISEAVELQDGRYKIIMQAADKELAGYWEEFIIDPASAWNVVSETGYTPSGRLRLIKEMKYYQVQDLPVLASAFEKEFRNEHSEQPTREVVLTVDLASMVVNPNLTIEDFRVIFPQDTQVQDEINHIQWVMPYDGVKEFSSDSEEVLAILAGHTDKVNLKNDTDRQSVHLDNNAAPTNQSIVSGGATVPKLLTVNVAYFSRWSMCMALVAGAFVLLLVWRIRVRCRNSGLKNKATCG